MSLAAPEPQDGGSVCTHSSILLYAMLILGRREQNPTDDAIAKVCAFIWVLKYICLIMLSLTRYSYPTLPHVCRLKCRRRHL